MFGRRDFGTIIYRDVIGSLAEEVEQTVGPLGCNANCNTTSFHLGRRDLTITLPFEEREWGGIRGRHYAALFVAAIQTKPVVFNESREPRSRNLANRWFVHFHASPERLVVRGTANWCPPRIVLFRC